MEDHPIWGINHLKLPASDILTTKDFYCNIMRCQYLPQFDHRNKQGELFAVMVQLNHNSGKVIIEIRQNPDQAEAQEGWVQTDGKVG